MRASRIPGLLLALFIGSISGASEPTTSAPATQPVFRAAPDLPETSAEDLVLLVRNVRSAIREKLAGKAEHSASYCPPALKGQTVTLHAAIRRDGAVLADAEQKPGKLVDASVAVGAMLGQSLLEKKVKIDLDACGLELEWFGPTEPITASN